MRTKNSDQYLTNRAWLSDATKHERVVLRGVSALEYLQLFSGYCGESEIEVYALKKGVYENVKYRVVNAFDGLDFFQHNGVLCSTAEQAINDLLADNTSDEQALAESLSQYYYGNKGSFAGLTIRKENRKEFERMKEWAIERYNERT